MPEILLREKKIPEWKATKCGKVAPPLQRSDRGGFEARVTLPGSQLRLSRAGDWNSGGRGTPYGVTHTHFARVSRSAPVSKSRQSCKQNIRLAVESFWRFDC